MKKILLVSGLVRAAIQKEDKNKKKYSVLCIESFNKDGFPFSEKITDFENRGFKEGQYIMVAAFEKVDLWKGKIVKNYTMVKAEIEKEIFSSLGIKQPVSEKIKL